MDILELTKSYGYSDVGILDYYDEPLIIRCKDELKDECILMLVSHTLGKLDEKYIKFRSNEEDITKYINNEIDLLTLINKSDDYYMIYGKSINKIDKIPSKYLPDEGYYCQNIEIAI